MGNKTATILLARAQRSDLPWILGDVIAVDRGVDFAYQHQVKIVHALGDFDSISNQSDTKLKQSKIPRSVYPKAKDDSDAQLAIAWALKHNYNLIQIVGFSGGRLDHYQALLQHVFFQRNPSIHLKNANNEIAYLGKGMHTINQKKWRYFSLFTFAEATVSLLEARYPLTTQTLTGKDTYTLSNQWRNRQPVILTIHRGGLLLFLTR